MSFEDCVKNKQMIDKHKQILSSLPNVKEVTDVTGQNEKNNDLTVITNYDKRYQTECKSDSSKNDNTILVELVANFRSVPESRFFSEGFYSKGTYGRQVIEDAPPLANLENFVEHLLQDEKYRSTAFYPYQDDVEYLFSYRVKINDDDKSYYLLDLKLLSKWIVENWKDCLLLVDKKDSCSIMVKLCYCDFSKFLYYEKKNIVEKEILSTDL